MARVIVALMAVLMLSGCSSWFVKTKVVTETKVVYQEKKVPVNACPAPEYITRPELYTGLINEHTSDGEVVKLYRATIIQLIDYADRQRQLIDKYDEISKQTPLLSDDQQ